MSIYILEHIGCTTMNKTFRKATAVAGLVSLLGMPLAGCSKKPEVNPDIKKLVELVKEKGESPFSSSNYIVKLNVRGGDVKVIYTDDDSPGILDATDSLSIETSLSLGTHLMNNDSCLYDSGLDGVFDYCREGAAIIKMDTKRDYKQQKAAMEYVKEITELLQKK